MEGEYGLWWDNHHQHARVGRILAIDEIAGTIDRQLLSVSGTARPRKVEWSGQVFCEPSDLKIDFSEPLIVTEYGTFPAWHFPNESTNWVIHIHGIRTNRLGPLRGVPVFNELNYHSLVVSFRGDHEGDQQPTHKASTLGMEEFDILDAAISYALSNGATKILLMGWSMGGGMALLANERGNHREAIDGLVLVAPTSNWREIVFYGAQQAHVPVWIGRVVIAALGHSLWSRLLGADASIDFASLDWTTRPNCLSVPTLILHSPGDTEVPFELSHKLKEQNRDVSLSSIPGADHTLEWNRDPSTVGAAIKQWVSRL